MDRGLNWQLAKDLNGLAGHVPLLDRLVAFIATDLIFVIILSAVVWWFLPFRRDLGKRGDGRGGRLRRRSSAQPDHLPSLLRAAPLCRAPRAPAGPGRATTRLSPAITPPPRSALP